MTFLGNRAPQFFSGGELNREETAASFRIGLQAFRTGHEADIRYRSIGGFRIRSRSPLDSTQNASIPELLLPNDLALVVRIERVKHARLLSGNKQAFAVR